MKHPTKNTKRGIFLLSSTLGAALLGLLAWAATEGGVAPYRFPLVAEEGRAEAAVAFYRARVETLPGSALDRAELAASYFSLGRRGDPRWFERAEVEARESLRLLPVSNLTAELVLAELDQARHRFEESLARAERILRQDPDHEGALALSLESRLAFGRTAEALRDADRLAQAAPSRGAFALRALAREQAGRAEAALADFRRAYAAEDLGDLEGAAWLRALWGRFHLRRGELRLARGLLREALRLRPESALGLGLMGELEAKRGRWREADRYFSEAYRVSGLPLYLAAQAKARRALDDRAGAEALWERAEASLRASLAAGEFGHRRELAELLLARGRDRELPEALSLAQEEWKLRRDPQTASVLIQAHAKTLRALWAKPGLASGFSAAVSY